MADKLSNEYRTLKKLHAYFKNDSCYNIPEPLYFSEEMLLLVTKEIKGISLETIGNQFARRVGAVDSSAVEAFQKAGKFLRMLHCMESVPFQENDVFELYQYITVRLIGVGIFSQDQEDQIVSFLDKSRFSIVHELSKYSRSPVHHDYNPTNILFDGHCINVLDFGDYRVDHPYQDLIYFRLMINGQLGSVLKYRQACRHKLLDAFYEGYGYDIQDHSGNEMYKIYLLKNLAVFALTMMQRKKKAINFKSTSAFLATAKSKVVNQRDYVLTKKSILEIVRA